MSKGVKTEMRSSPRIGFAPRWRPIVLVGVLVAAFAQSGEALAQEMTADEAENFVRTRWFEGMPEAEATRIGPVATVRLISLLEDEAERSTHAKTLLALGMSGQQGALGAVSNWAGAPRGGEVDRATYRAWQALPFALAHVAQWDRRAIGRLEAELARVPTFRFRHHTPARLRGQGQRGVVNALSATGLPEADAALERARGRASDPAFRAHIDEAISSGRRSMRTEEVGR